MIRYINDIFNGISQLQPGAYRPSSSISLKYIRYIDWETRPHRQLPPSGRSSLKKQQNTPEKPLNHNNEVQDLEIFSWM